MLWNVSVVPKYLIGKDNASTGDSRTERYQSPVGHFKLGCTQHIYTIYTCRFVHTTIQILYTYFTDLYGMYVIFCDIIYIYI